MNSYTGSYIYMMICTSLHTVSILVTYQTSIEMVIINSIGFQCFFSGKWLMATLVPRMNAQSFLKGVGHNKATHCMPHHFIHGSDINTTREKSWYLFSLVPRPIPAFQCCTLKNWRAWESKSRDIHAWMAPGSRYFRSYLWKQLPDIFFKCISVIWM